MPDTNRDSSEFWKKDDSGAIHLKVAFDSKTKKHYFPLPPDSLTALLNLEQRTLSSNGTLYSYTVLHPHRKSSRPPFTLAFVDFPEGVRLMGLLKLSDGEHPIVGSRLETAMATDSNGKTDYIFRQVPGEKDK